MAKKAAWLFCIILVVMPVFSADTPRATPEFYFTRLIYPSGSGGMADFGFGRGRGGGSWRTDYPEADYKFMWGVERMTNISVYPNENAVDVDDPDLFKYPYLYIVEPGRMNLSAVQAETLREYLDRGGFLHIDDFWGLRELTNLSREMTKIYPERVMQELPMSHPVFHTFFDVTDVMQIPNVNNGCRGGQTWEDPSDIAPRIFGISDENDNLKVVITYNSDLGDAWEHMDVPCYPELFSGQAYRMGINFIIYAMTH